MRRHLAVSVLAAALLLAAGSADAQPGRFSGPFPVQNINPDVHRVVATGSMSGAVIFQEVPLDPVPTGKRFVVEFVSGEFFLGTGQVPKMEIRGSASDGPFYAIPLVKALSPGIGDFFQASSLVRFYLDAGETYNLTATRNPGGGTASFQVTLSGYLVDVP